MRRTTFTLLVGAVLAALAIGAFTPTAIAVTGTDTHVSTPTDAAENATELRAQYIASWMEARLGPEGVAAFEDRTGTTIETVARAMAEYVVPWSETPTGHYHDGPVGGAPEYGPSGEYGPGTGPGGYGPQPPCHGGHGHGMGGYGGHGSGWGGGW
ncbi:MAG: hypothetical protein ABEJ60_01805 [Halodesulfurarchaeum sp.]